MELWCTKIYGFVKFNSILIIGAVFRKINPDKFQDLPGIIMPSLGLAMIGIIGIVAYLA